VAIDSAGEQANDDVATICAISLLAAMLDNMLHEGLGHAAIALLTGAPSGVLSTVAWSSEFDTRLVAAGGTLVNLAAGAVLWIVLRSAKGAAVPVAAFSAHLHGVQPVYQRRIPLVFGDH